MIDKTDQELTEEIGNEGGLLMGYEPRYANWRFPRVDESDFSRANPILRIFFAVTAVILPAILLIWVVILFGFDTREKSLIGAVGLILAIFYLLVGIKILLTSKKQNKRLP